jgi:hypothetical protein
LQRLSKAHAFVSIKTIIVIIAVIALVGAGWFFRDSDVVRGAAGTAQTFVKEVLPDNSYTAGKTNAEKSAGKADRAKESHALRKCVSEARTVYTDEKCPPGTREAPISEGSVTVMPSQRTGGKPKAEEKAK